MKGWSLSVGALTSIGVHVASVLVLSKPVPPKALPKQPTVVELAVLPPNPPEPSPPPKPVVPEPVRLKPKLSHRQPDKPQLSTPASPQNVAPELPAAPTPLLLAGLTLSNEGVGVPSGFGAAASPRAVASRESTVGPSKATADGSLTPVSDLSKKPVPPALDAALTRYYPSSLRQRGIEGEALIRVVLAKDGRVSQTQTVSESHPGFAPACEKALRTSRWAPPIDKSGNATRTALKYRCRFKVNL